MTECVRQDTQIDNRAMDALACMDQQLLNDQLASMLHLNNNLIMSTRYSS